MKWILFFVVCLILFSLPVRRSFEMVGKAGHFSPGFEVKERFVPPDVIMTYVHPGDEQGIREGRRPGLDGWSYLNLKKVEVLLRARMKEITSSVNSCG